MSGYSGVLVWSSRDVESSTCSRKHQFNVCVCVHRTCCSWVSPQPPVLFFHSLLLNRAPRAIIQYERN